MRGAWGEGQLQSSRIASCTTNLIYVGTSPACCTQPSCVCVFARRHHRHHQPVTPTYYILPPAHE